MFACFFIANCPKNKIKLYIIVHQIIFEVRDNIIQFIVNKK
uniref:Uncharacterized protein n=1 Tax=Anguilla anguilla TaxID=7936 RepID=A0A0E9QQ02_ANGAN